MTPYKRKEVIGNATLYLGDCLEILPTLPKVDAVITDPPYPNGEGHFIDGIAAAWNALSSERAPVHFVFWSEVEMPPLPMPLVAVHIWHRTNVNGKIYEPIYQCAKDRVKRRSEIKAHAAVFNGVGPGCNEYAGHPTQKPAALMEWLIKKVPATRGPAQVLDPFMGSGTTGVACMNLGRKFIGIEIEPKYFDIACRRIEDAQRQVRMFA
jgi:DNA modification methylase